MSLLGARDAIVAKVKAKLPTLLQCEGHGGNFDKTEVSRIATKTPAALIVCLGAVASNVGGEPMADVRWAAFFITSDIRKDEKTVRRGDVALNLVEQFQRLLATDADATWGLDGAQMPAKVRAENRYSGQVDERALALWVVTWEQRMSLKPSDQDSALDDLLRVDAKIERNDATASEDVVQVGS